MYEFENKLIIKEEKYSSGFFTKIPNFQKNGSAFILTDGSHDDIVVDEYTTAKEIRHGKYTKLIEISTMPYLKEIKFSSESREIAYSFDIYIKAVIQVEKPILFYQNKNIDVDAYFNNMLSLDVKRITRRYSILDYDGMDEELMQELAIYNTSDKITGLSYQISAVWGVPGEKAATYVEQYSKLQLDAALRDNARRLSSQYTYDYQEAIMTAVAEGKLSEIEAIEKIEMWNNSSIEHNMNLIDELRKRNMITDKMARRNMENILLGEEKKYILDSTREQETINKNDLDKFFDEGEK